MVIKLTQVIVSGPVSIDICEYLEKEDAINLALTCKACRSVLFHHQSHVIWRRYLSDPAYMSPTMYGITSKWDLDQINKANFRPIVFAIPKNYFVTLMKVESMLKEGKLKSPLQLQLLSVKTTGTAPRKSAIEDYFRRPTDAPKKSSGLPADITVKVPKPSTPSVSSFFKPAPKPASVFDPVKRTHEMAASQAVAAMASQVGKSFGRANAKDMLNAMQVRKRARLDDVKGTGDGKNPTQAPTT